MMQKSLYTIETVEYGDEPVSRNNYLDIVNAPSSAAVFDRYPFKDGYHIREEGIQVLRTKIDPKTGIQNIGEQVKHTMNSLEEKYNEFSEKNETSLEVKNKVFEYLSKVGK